jgi:hypothetical protein
MSARYPVLLKNPTLSAVTSLIDGALIAIDANRGPHYALTLGGSRTLDNPTNSAEALEVHIAVKQDGTGGRTLLFGSDWVAVDAAVSVNPAPNTVSYIHAVSNDVSGSVKWYYVVTHAAESAGGEVNTASNVGTGSAWYKQKTGVNLEFKTALGGYGVTVTPGALENTVGLKTTVVTLTDGVTVALDADTGPHYELIVAGNRIIGNPTNASAGKVVELLVTQDATGGREISFSTDWIPTGKVFQVAQAPNAHSVVHAVCRGGSAKWYYNINHSEFTETTDTVTSNQTAWAPIGRSYAHLIRVSADALRNIQGIGAPVLGVEQTFLHVVLTGSFNLILKNQDAGAVASNRIILPSGSDLTIEPNDAVTLQYDFAAQRWRLT